MKYRLLVALPLVFTAVVAVAMALFPDEASRVVALRIEIELVKVLAVVGCTVAALAFDKGDYLRRAWLLNALCFVVLLVRDVTFLLPHAGDDVSGGALLSVRHLQVLLVLVANAVSVAGTWMMARAWQVAGIDPSQSKWRVALVLGAGAVALAITGTAIFADARDAALGDTGSIEGLASDFGDVFSLCVIAPVFLTAWAMRGGVLRWPWALYTASLVGWLVYDAVGGVATLVHLDPWIHRVAVELCRTLSCTFLLSAGIAQRLVVTSTEPPAALR